MCDALTWLLGTNVNVRVRSCGLRCDNSIFTAHSPIEMKNMYSVVRFEIKDQSYAGYPRR